MRKSRYWIRSAIDVLEWRPVGVIADTLTFTGNKKCYRLNTPFSSPSKPGGLARIISSFHRSGIAIIPLVTLSLTR